MRNLININQVVTRNCGGYGAWIDNALSSAAPGDDIWPGFQVGGGSKRQRRASHKRKHRNSRNSKKHNIRKISRIYKKTRRNI
jgi:hypothetical protein